MSDNALVEGIDNVSLDNAEGGSTASPQQPAQAAPAAAADAAQAFIVNSYGGYSKKG